MRTRGSEARLQPSRAWGLAVSRPCCTTARLESAARASVPRRRKGRHGGLARQTQHNHNNDKDKYNNDNDDDTNDNNHDNNHDNNDNYDNNDNNSNHTKQ